MSNHLQAHSTRRLAAWQHSGTSLDYITWVSQQWETYDRAHGTSASDRAFSLGAYHLHQERFTAWLEQRQEVRHG